MSDQIIQCFSSQTQQLAFHLGRFNISTSESTHCSANVTTRTLG